MKKTLIITLVSVIFLTAFFTIENVWVKNRQDYIEYNLEIEDEYDYSNLAYYSTSDYYNYLDLNSSVFPQVDPIVIEALDYTDIEGDFETFDVYEGIDDVLLTDEYGSVTWEVDVENAGYYNLNINYYPYVGKSSSIERTLYINGEVPFEGATYISFYRIWGNNAEIVQDINGNDIRPSQVELPEWTSSYFNDHIGYVDDPFMFYFNEGINTIKLLSVREPLMVKSIELLSVVDIKSYSEVLADYQNEGYSEVAGSLELFQAETTLYSSSPTLYPLNDRTSPLTDPSSPTLVKLNTIGGNNWRIAGDKITWDFTVEEDGLYNISLRVKQKLASGMNVSRNIYIDGEIPFTEMKNYAFQYSGDWRIQTLGSPDETYLFYFEAGVTHTITLEVSLGNYGPLIAQIQESISNLNELYREILIYTGPQPDPYRDYQLEDRVDNLIYRIRTERDNLQDVREKLIVFSGSRSDKTGIIDTVILQLDDYLDKPSEIHQNLLSYNSNISSLGTLVILLSAQPLEIDYFMIHDSESILPQSKASAFSSLIFNIKAFLATFVTDYSSLGETEASTSDETVEVWLSIGRDQANVLRKMIDETFTPVTGVKIDLKLVNGAVLLPATLSKVGPDIAMGLGNSIPVNYAMRNAVYDISQYPDFDEVTDRFKDSAMVPYEYEGGYYALPEQQIFLMMFYRTDIFDELGLDYPDTWADVISIIPDLQKHNLEFYLPIPINQGLVMNLPPNPIYSTLFYQNDGEFYIDGNTKSGFNEGSGPQVFETWTQFYTDYSFPVQANFVNRFRSGQMPIGITYYNTYNTLSVFAPEIRGKWDFVPVPGTVVTDEAGNETIRRETVSTGTGIMIMEQSEHKDASWEFLKWWTSTSIQVQFGREMEGILGAAARYPTANVEALSQLPWTVIEYLKLEEQWDWVIGIPEVPGGYMTGRHLDNAFRLVYNDNSNPKETIYDYVQVINDEIEKKRREFGLGD
ncbi:MAG: extracellular solute-binding protein [Candidatus Izimaplasma sp.]|nr:extracellular solute-binding protein [Candidatus Izimaplasma bacterium]